MIWKMTVVEWDIDPLVPVMVTLYDPVVDPVQDRVEVTDPPFVGVTLDGLRLQVKPVEGEITAVTATGLLNPFWLLTVIVDVAATPRFVVTELGLAPIVKSGAPPTL